MPVPAGVRIRRLVAALLVAGLSAVAPAGAQVVRQLTDVKTTITGPGSIDDAGSLVYAVSSTDQLLDNTGHAFQVFEFDAVTAAAVRKTTFADGVAPTDLGFDVPVPVTVSDDGIWLAFVSSSNPLGTNADGSPELFVMRTDGTGLAQLTSDPHANAGSALRARISGSGNRVAFTATSRAYGANLGFAEQLYVVERDGSGLRQLTFAAGGEFSGLALSDDGSRIVFSHNGELGDVDDDGSPDNPDGSFEVYSIGADGTGLMQLTSATGYDSTSCDISGNGSTIVFDSTANLTSGNSQHQREIFAVDWGGANMRKLTSTNAPAGQEGFAFAPTVSDDGQTVVFAANGKQGNFNADGNIEIFSITSSGSSLTGLTDTEFSDGNFLPVVSGNGSRIVFLSVHDHTGGNPDQTLQLHAMDSAGGNIVQLTTGANGRSEQPDVTPDGTWVAFASNLDLLGGDPDRGGEIYLIQANGSGLSQVSDIFVGAATDPSVSDDATKLAFVSDGDPAGMNADGSEEVFSIDASGSNVVQLSNATASGRTSLHPFIAGDGSQIFFDSTDDPLGTNNDSSREIFRVLPDGSGMVQVTDGPSATQSRNPRSDTTGGWLVFESNADFGGASDGFVDVWRVRSDGTGLARLIPNASFNSFDPDISADGSVVVFSSSADPLGTNPENNPEIFAWRAPSGPVEQLTSSATGGSRLPRVTGDGRFAFFLTDAPHFEEDPDRPVHIARVDLDTGEVERAGGLARGIPEEVSPDADGDIVVFYGVGDFSLSNSDYLSELWVIDGTLSADEIEISGAAPTTVSFPVRSGAMRYDVLRGDAARLRASTAEYVNLGVVACLENDSINVDTAGSEDAVDPAPGGIFFYLHRPESGVYATQSEYGSSAIGYRRQAAAGDCALPVAAVECSPAPTRGSGELFVRPRQCVPDVYLPQSPDSSGAPGRTVDGSPPARPDESEAVRQRLPRRDLVPDVRRRPLRTPRRTDGE